VNPARRGAAQLAVDAIEVGKYGQARGQGKYTQGVEEHGHGLGEPQFAAKLTLAAIHLAFVGLVIVAHQVEHSVEDEDAHFVVEGAAELLRVAPRNRGSDGDVAEMGRNRECTP
jgi:hypothetical protein